MIPMPRRCVVDASVLIKYFVPESYSDLSQSLIIRLLGEDDGLTIPDLAFIECTNILWKKVRRGDLAPSDAEQILADLAATQITAVSTSELMARAFAIGHALDITAYDACYVALGERLAIPLVTADDRLAAKLARSTHTAISLADLASP
jgi:predicted nucleic acid-binding protein